MKSTDTPGGREAADQMMHFSKELNWISEFMAGNGCHWSARWRFVVSLCGAAWLGKHIWALKMTYPAPSSLPPSLFQEYVFGEAGCPPPNVFAWKEKMIWVFFKKKENLISPPPPFSLPSFFLPDEVLGKRRVSSPNSSSECPLESKKSRSESPKGRCLTFFSCSFYLFSVSSHFWSVGWEGGLGGKDAPGSC